MTTIKIHIARLNSSIAPPEGRRCYDEHFNLGIYHDTREQIDKLGAEQNRLVAICKQNHKPVLPDTELKDMYSQALENANKDTEKEKREIYLQSILTTLQPATEATIKFKP